MLRNYFKIAWRNLVKDRQFTFLNLIGLATGLACAIGIYLWVSDELHMDKFNAKDSQLFQVMKNSIFLITLFAVSFQSVKAALINPVKSLKSE